MSSALDTTWEYQRKWSLAANRLKRSYHLWKLAVLALAVIGALLETLSAQIASQDIAVVLALMGAIALGLIPVIGIWKSGMAQLSSWVSARSISEELKAQVCVYLAQCGDYADDEARDDALVKARTRYLENADHSKVAAIDLPVTKPPAIKAAKKHGLDSYVELRLEKQIRYYERATARESRAVSRYRTAQFALAIAAAVLGVAGTVVDEVKLAAWVAVVTTFGASVAAALAAGRHEHLVLSYGSTARRLKDLRDTRDSGDDPSAFVGKCEAAISSQNEGWMAGFLKQPSKETH